MKKKYIKNDKYREGKEFKIFHDNVLLYIYLFLYFSKIQNLVAQVGGFINMFSSTLI